MTWLGMSSRMCWNAQEWYGASCQFASVTIGRPAGSSELDESTCAQAVPGCGA